MWICVEGNAKITDDHGDFNAFETQLWVYHYGDTD